MKGSWFPGSRGTRLRHGGGRPVEPSAEKSLLRKPLLLAPSSLDPWALRSKESRVARGWGKGEKKKGESCQILHCGPWGQTPKATGSSQLWIAPILPRPPRRQLRFHVWVWVEREESRSIRAGYLPGSSIRTEIRVNCYGQGMLHSGASFILHLAQEMYV